LGAGLFKEGDIALATGTAWIITGIFNKPVFDSSTYIAPGRHVVGGLWGALASIPTGGVSMEWFRDNLGFKLMHRQEVRSESFMDIDGRILSSGKKADGLFFYPYFSGSGFPGWNGSLKAGLLGLGLEHDRYDVALAIMEGLVFEAGVALEWFAEKGCRPARLKMLGGASNSPVWMEIAAAASGLPVVKMKGADSAVVGAAIIAGTGCGIFGDYAEGYRKMGLEDACIEVNGDKRDYYREKFGRYKKGIELLKAFY
jgi:sugar (pentulose or hexulose) kinase